MNKNWMLSHCLMILGFVACSSGIKQKKVDDDLVLRQRTFIDELYMSPISSWSNYSDANQCKRENDWLYLNLPEVIKKTNLSYLQSLNLQYQVNALWHQKKPFVAGDYAQRLLPADRLSLLEQALERVNGGVNFWNPPMGSYPIWLIDWDKILPDERLNFLTSVLSHPEVKNVIPVIISRCSSSYTIKNILELRPELLSFSFILGVEVLTIFPIDNTQNEILPFAHPIEIFFESKSIKTWVMPMQEKVRNPKNQYWYMGKVYKAFYL
jgi:hypothetical protein